MTGDQVLFCPFCRESFEQEKRCPEHELDLVPFDRLGPDPEDPANDPAVQDATPVDTMSLKYGRGWLMLGAALNVLALLTEMVAGVGDSQGLNGYELAVSVPSLWTLLLVSFVLLHILRTRRAPVQMRSLRLLVPILAFIPALTVAWAFGRLMNGAPVYAAGTRLVGHQPSTGVYLAALASLSILVGGLRFGRGR